MMGLEISKKPKVAWSVISLAALGISLALGIWVGPIGVYIASALGLVAAGVSYYSRPKESPAALQKSFPILIVSLLVSHVCFLVIGLVLDSLFLKPLADDSLQFPRLTQKYKDPDGIFELRAPSGWTTESIHASMEAGVRLRPSDRQQYMGVSELTIRVRQLENVPKQPAKFLEQMVQTFTANTKKNKKLFDFSTYPAKLINGEQGLWSHLVVKRFWIPLYQMALFGIKDKRYLCSVSASGLKNHSTLSEVLCLGVFETIKVHREQT